MPRRYRVPIEEILFRTLLLWLINVIALVFAAYLLPGVYVTSLGGAALFMAIISVVNALLWPLLARVTLPFMVLSLGLFSIVLSGGLFYLVGRVVEGVTFTNVIAATVTAVFVGVVNALTASLLTIDDDAAFLRGSIQRTMRRMTNTGPRKGYPGVILLEIDGCSEAVFRRAVETGLMPTMASWLKDGTHRIVGWETDLSCQTGAAQAGILHGSNHNIPAFRWVEKSLDNRVISANGPKDSPLIEQRINNGEGLLSVGGAARINLFTGNATDDLLVYSTLTSLAQVYKPSYYVFFSNPYNFVRTLTLTLVDVVHEWRERRRQVRENVWPRIPEHRKGVYPFVRAATTVLLRDMSVYTLIGDIFAGEADVIYATFYAYDEVAHHSGVEDRDALNVLRQLDKAFARVARAVEEADRPYQIAVLSDHGQSKGATFKQRYGMTLKDLVATLLPGGLKTYQELSTDEGWGHVGALMTEAAQTNTRVVSKTVRRMSRKRMRDGEVLVGPDYKRERAVREGKAVTATQADLIVLASGNLGLIYFTAWQERLTLDQIDEAFPDLIGGLVAHPGIGFVMVRSEESGPLAIGARGVYYLAEGRFTGENPLANFRPGVPEHLCRTDSFDNAPDILVNSFYDPELDEGAAFEELIGFHGGAGGNQSHPFLFVPNGWTIDTDGPIVGAEQVHRALKRQLVRLRRGNAADLEPEAEPIMTDPQVS